MIVNTIRLIQYASKKEENDIIICIKQVKIGAFELYKMGS